MTRSPVGLTLGPLLFHWSVDRIVDFYARIAEWVAPGGTLLIVGHLHGHGDHPDEASARAADAAALLAPERWDVVTAEERRREMLGRDGRPYLLHDVVVRAVRR